MLIFQVNDDMKLSQEEYQRWKDYLQTNKALGQVHFQVLMICPNDTY